ncbi:MAG: LysM peptidoglycan-binding domain-containing protein [Ruminococcaceae bacterium]|nr:LysM peptidoglycan-binding domain-containing protein [Oscillospiraceae bacterium]
MKSRKRKRMWYVCLAAFVAVCMITSFVRANQTEYTTREVVVQEGDTLWGIWEEVGHGRADKWIAEVRSINNMETADLQPYDRLTVPVVKGE